jgi:hypothetical protein
MAPLRLALICALGVLLLTPQAAAGGGWWSYIDVNRSTVAAGQRVEVEAAVAFESTAAAEEAQEAGRFYVYLLRGFDDAILEPAMREPSPRNWWSLGGAEAIPVGQVTVSVPGANLGKARAAFTVPELPHATYHVMLCDAACAEPLADVIPTEGFTVVADPATVQMAQRVDRLARRIRNQAGRLAAAGTDANRGRIAAQDARSEIERLERRVSYLARDRRSSPPVAPWVAYAGWLVAGALTGAVVLLVLRHRRSWPPRPTSDARWHPSDEELNELLSSEPERHPRIHSP